jgi:AcrR family transcriptional regulator
MGADATDDPAGRRVDAPVPGRRNKTQARGDASRSEIMDAASRLVLAHGYKGMTVAALCRETGLPPTSIYWHFGSKEGVLLAAMQRSAERFSAETDTLQDLGESPRERLGALLRAAGSALQERPEFVRMLMRLVLQQEGLDTVSPSLVEMRMIGRTALIATVRTAYQPLGPQLASEIAVGISDTAMAMFDGLFIALQIDRAIDRERVFAQMADVLIDLGERVRAEKEPTV